MDPNEPRSAFWRETLLAVLIFLALLAVLILGAAGAPPFAYGKF